MKTIDLTQQKASIKDLLQLANVEPLLILSEDGHHYILEEADEFAREAKMLGKSDKFMEFLEERSKETATTPLDDLEKKLGLKSPR
ncbi:MAG: hypothetical protein ACE5HO_17300 [bacterium]